MRQTDLVPFLLGRLATAGQGAKPQVFAQKWLSTMYHSAHLPKSRCICHESTTKQARRRRQHTFRGTHRRV